VILTRFACHPPRTEMLISRVASGNRRDRGACRHLVKDRMDITGARQGPDGAEAILKLRALIASGDFSECWPFHLRQEHQRVHRFHYGLPA
jgi:hypothetical protein